MSDSLYKNAARVLIVTFIIALMVIARPFLVPLAWALLISMASYRMLHAIEVKTRMPRALINALFLVLLLVILLAVGYLFYVELAHIFKALPDLTGVISERIHGISKQLQGTGLTLPEHIDRTIIQEWLQQHNDIILNMVSGIGGNLGNILLIMFYMFFLLYYRELFFQYFTHTARDTKKLVNMRHRFNQSLNITRNYLLGLLIITLLSGVINFVVLLLFGLPFALFFGFFLAILNLIPLIGNPVGLIIIFLFASVTGNGMLWPFMILLGLLGVNFIQDNVLRPWLMGDTMKLNAFAVFVSVIIGGMIWGVSGMILFIPMVGILKIFLEANPDTAHIAMLLGDKSKAAIEQVQD